MTYTFIVRIGRKGGLSDPEGTATAKALRDLGFDTVEGVTFGRTVTIEIDAQSEEGALVQVGDMCRKLLANPVMENYTIETAQ